MATIVVGGLLLTAAAGGVAAGATAGAIVVRKKRRAKKLKALRKKLFGESISTLNPKFLTDRGIPVVIEMTARQMENKGAETEGLFRVPGSASRIQILADAFRKGSEKALAKVNLELEDTHDVGGLFKLYFRSLPEALCTFDLYQDFVEVQGLELELDAWIDKVSDLLSKLPEINRLVFLRILPFFHHVCSFAETNKMNYENMSIVFGPTLFFSGDNDPMSILTNSSHICNLLTKMIIHHEKIVQRLKTQTSTTRWKNNKKTINASVLFTKQQLMTELYGADYEDGELQPEEIEAIRELLVDEFELPTEGGDKLNIQDESFFNAPTDAAEIPPQALAGKPLPTPPPRKDSGASIKLEKEDSTGVPSGISLAKPSAPQKKLPPAPPPRKRAPPTPDVS